MRCSNYYGATDDLNVIAASSLVGLAGIVSATTLDVRGADLGPPGVVGHDGSLSDKAIADGMVSGQSSVSSSREMHRNDESRKAPASRLFRRSENATETSHVT